MQVHKDTFYIYIYIYIYIYMKVKRLFYKSQEVFFTSTVKVIIEKGI